MSKQESAPLAGAKLTLREALERWVPKPKIEIVPGKRGIAYQVENLSGHLTWGAEVIDPVEWVQSLWLEDQVRKGRFEFDGYPEGAKAISDGRRVVRQDFDDDIFFLFGKNIAWLGEGKNSEALHKVRLWKVESYKYEEIELPRAPGSGNTGRPTKFHWDGMRLMLVKLWDEEKIDLNTNEEKTLKHWTNVARNWLLQPENKPAAEAGKSSVPEFKEIRKHVSSLLSAYAEEARKKST